MATQNEIEEAREYEYQRRLSSREYWRDVLRNNRRIPAGKRALYERFANREINREDVVVTPTASGFRFY